jgi:hypothetical protein
MLNQKTLRVSMLLSCAVFLALTSTVTAQQRRGETAQGIREELMAAAEVHKVSINIDKMLFVGDKDTLMAQAPITGIEKYGDKEFAGGAPIQLLLVRSAITYDVPNGSYVVKAQYEPRASSGTATFFDQNGKVAATRKLFIKSLKESASYFPDVYGGSGPQEIPVVTSWHVFSGYYFDPVLHMWRPRYMVDCAGWIPYRVLYY